MKKWPIIRHIRYFRLRRLVDRHYEHWQRLGYLPVNRDKDEAHLLRVWEGLE